MYSNHSIWYPDSKPLSLEEELELAENIKRGKDLIDIPRDLLSDSDASLRKKAEKSINKLIAGYSPLIEKIAKEYASTSGGYGVDIDDYIAEAYTIATQCARSFDPKKGRNVIRFSSYAPRPIAAALNRMMMKSRAPVSIASGTVSDARKWSHTCFEMRHLGIDVTDEEISSISGVNMTESQVRHILGLGNDTHIEDIQPPVINDEVILDDEEAEREYLADLICGVLGEPMGSAVNRILGIDDKRKPATNEREMISLKKVGVTNGTISYVREYLSHPAVRMSIKRKIV